MQIEFSVCHSFQFKKQFVERFRSSLSFCITPWRLSQEGRKEGTLQRSDENLKLSRSKSPEKVRDVQKTYLKRDSKLTHFQAFKKKLILKKSFVKKWKSIKIPKQEAKSRFMTTYKA